MIDPMIQLERDDASAVLYAQLARARSARGGVVIVAGEAGIGKTTLVRSFLRHGTGVSRALVGGCDPLESPRPLAPLIDAARPVAPDLARRLASGVPRATAFASALDLIDDAGGPVVFVLEDLHWADDATLDLFTFLARRLETRPALLVVTFRSDEVDDRHPLRLRLGDIHAHVLARIELHPLSVEAVRILVEEAELPDASANDVYEASRGNPFFVTEIIASMSGGRWRSDTVPETVRDAVLARASRLPPNARVVLDAASVIPGRGPRWLVAAIADVPSDQFVDGLETCCALGLLERQPDGFLQFRHELGRLAIERALPESRGRAHHAAALAALRGSPSPTDLARLAYHAAGADDGAAVVDLAPRAAREAAAAGGYREAAALIESALRYAHLYDAGLQGDLLLRLAHARSSLGHFEAELDAACRAARSFAGAGDLEREAEAYVECSKAEGLLGRRADGIRYLERAGDLLGDDPPPSRAVVLLESAWCSEYMLARIPGDAETHGQRAMSLATEIDEPALFAQTAIQSGISLCMAGDDSGLERVRRGMQIGAELGDDQLVAHGHRQIGSGYGELRRYDIALPALRQGIEYTAERELVGPGMYIAAWLARCELETGDWASAGRRAAELAALPRCVGTARFVTLVTLGWLRSRRGDPGVDDTLDEALELARTASHVQRMWPVAACRAEHAWMHDRLDDEMPVLAEALEMATALDYRPAIEELEHWYALAGESPPVERDDLMTPFGLSAVGHAARAAAAWDAIGCPYEAAFARLLTGDPDNLRDAARTFDELGSTPMRERTTRVLRDRGERVPRGPNRSTSSNPHGLTDRELDVLALLPSGSTNAEIGATLYISERTVGHHVSRILSKLDVSTRAEAAVVAVQLGLA